MLEDLNKEQLIYLVRELADCQRKSYAILEKEFNKNSAMELSKKMDDAIQQFAILNNISQAVFFYWSTKNPKNKTKQVQKYINRASQWSWSNQREYPQQLMDSINKNIQDLAD